VRIAAPLLSAHRGGPGPDASRENTLEAMVEAGALTCEYVEFDIQRCRGGVHVLYHDDFVLDGRRRLPIASLTFDEFRKYADTWLELDDALRIFRDRKKVHLDLKFLSDPEDGGREGHGHEVALVEHVIEVMGAENLIVTTLEDDSVRAVRAWSRERYPGLLVGLSLGRDVSGLGLLSALRTRLSEAFPGRRLRRCDANLVVCEKTLARFRIAGWARRHGMPLLVWTVDQPRELRRWLRDPRVWLITTNYPRRALRLRDDLCPEDDEGAPPRLRRRPLEVGVTRRR
jgi:glycerophosphoryl diester phosphodiesterase